MMKEFVGNKESNELAQIKKLVIKNEAYLNKIQMIKSLKESIKISKTTNASS
jgi:hypothetical protein